MPVVEPKLELIQVGWKMLRTDLMIRPHNRPFEEREGSLDRVGVDVTTYPFVRRVGHRLVLGVFVLYALVALPLVGENAFGLRVGVLLDESVQDLLCAATSLCHEPDVSTALDSTKYHGLIFTPEASTLAFDPATDVGFVGFHSASQQFCVSVLQGGADAMAQVPRRLIGDLENSLELVRGYALSGLTHHIDGGEPLPKRQVGIMEERSGLDGELVTA